MSSRLPIGQHVESLEPYTAVLEDRAWPKLVGTSRNPSELEIEGPVPAGMLISVQATYEGGWVSTQHGARIPAEADAMGLILLDPRPLPVGHITLKYRGTREQRLMAAICILSWLGVRVVVIGRRR